MATPSPVLPDVRWQPQPLAFAWIKAQLEALCADSPALAALGHQPRPLIVSTLPVSALYRMIGATPPRLVRSAWVTLMHMPVATPASMALPPASRMRAPAAAAR